MMHEGCLHAQLCPGVIYCLKSEILFIRADLVTAEDSGTDSKDPFEVFSRVSRLCLKALKGCPVSGILLVGKNVPLPAPTPELSKVHEAFFNLERNLAAKGLS